MTPLEMTAITDFVLACEACFVAGLLLAGRGSYWTSRGFWAWAMLLLGVGALLGGIDHGFVEPYGPSVTQTVVQRATRLSILGVGYLIMLTISREYTKRSATRKLVSLGGLIIFIGFVTLYLIFESFLMVVLGYAPAVLLLLVLNVVGVRNGRGSWSMIAGLLLSIAGAAVVSFDVGVYWNLNKSGIYHIIMMAAVPFLYLAGKRLNSKSEMEGKDARDFATRTAET